LDFDAFAELRWDRDQLDRAAEVLYPGGNVPKDSPLSAEKVASLRGLIPLREGSLEETITRAYAQIDIRSAIADSVAVCCFFGAVQRSPLMWAHYGGNHHGLCVEFEVTENPGDLYEVEYSSTRPRVTLSELLFSPWETVLRVLRAKHLDWAYEHEFRTVARGQQVRDAVDGVTVPFPAWLSPVGVILGARVAEGGTTADGESPFANGKGLAAALGVPLRRVLVRDQELSTELLVDAPEPRGRAAG
jgi:hypothetical protein